MAPRRRWTTDTIETELRGLIAELGHLPTRSELEARGLSGLYKAMRRDGADWTHLTAPAPLAPRRPDPEHVAVAAYFLHRSGVQGDPLTHWLQAEQQLAGAA